MEGFRCECGAEEAFCCRCGTVNLHGEERAFCKGCHVTELDAGLDNLRRELASEIASQQQSFQSRTNFLRLPVDIKSAEGSVNADVVILVQDKKDELLYAHKVVLASKSPVFCKMFETDMLERETGIVRVDDATLPVMRALIMFCYNAEINFTDEVTSEEVMGVAHKYDIDYLAKICEEHLIQRIDRGNFLRMLKLAKTFKAERLKLRAWKYFKTHVDEGIHAVVEELL